MPPKAKASSKNKNLGPKFKFSGMLGKVLLGLIVALIATGAYLLINQQNESAKPTQPYAYTYKTLVDYKLTGEKSGAGMSVKQFKEFTPASSSGAKQVQAMSVHNFPDKTPPVMVAQLAMASVATTSTPTDEYAKSLKKILSDSADVAYPDSVKPLQDFIKDRVPSGYNVSLGGVKEISTANLKTNTWAIDFSAKAKKASDTAKLPNLKGREIFTFSKNAFYYFMLDAVDYIWQSNQSIIMQSIDSIKIDQ